MRTRKTPGRERRKAPRRVVARVSVTEAVRGFSHLVNRVLYRGDRFVLTRGGRPVAEVGPVAGAHWGTFATVVEAWRRRKRMPPEEVDAFAKEIEDARESLPPVEDRWA